MAGRSDPYQRIYAIVRRVPRGRIATYGQIAALAGLGGHARQVGYALHALDTGSALPWHRVLNAQGRVSPRAEPGGDRVQRALLEREGVRFDAAGRADLARFGWRASRSTKSADAQRGKPERRAEPERERSASAKARQCGGAKPTSRRKKR